MLRKLMIVSIVLLMGTGCKNENSNDPKSVLTKFFKALSKKDIATARKLTTEEGQFMLDYIEQVIKTDKGISFTGAMEQDKIEYGQPVIDKDQATISVKELTSGTSMNYTLKLQDKQWKVDFNIASLLNEGIDQMKKEGMEPIDSIQKALDDFRKINKMLEDSTLIDSVNNKLNGR
ncbi:MAG: hypothetical protein JST81_13765 [Bacteroidetes bacterium]|nr:hypothetical protein [Bacteroidota bacterium]